jgi:hypothetical protein
MSWPTVAPASRANSQIAINLNHGEMAQTFHQGLGQGSKARTDFNHALTRNRINGSDNGINDGVIGQKMLTESFSR